MSIDDPNSLLSSEIKLKHLTTPLIIAVLMQGAIRCMTVPQLYPQDMQSLSTFVRACNDSILLVARTPLTEAYTGTLVLCTMPVCVPCHAYCVRPAHPILQTPPNSLYSLLTS
jgi:hypothetical protein